MAKNKNVLGHVCQPSQKNICYTCYNPYDELYKELNYKDPNYEEEEKDAEKNELNYDGLYYEDEENNEENKLNYDGLYYEDEENNEEKNELNYDGLEGSPLCPFVPQYIHDQFLWTDEESALQIRLLLLHIIQRDVIVDFIFYYIFDYVSKDYTFCPLSNQYIKYIHWFEPNCVDIDCDSDYIFKDYIYKCKLCLKKMIRYESWQKGICIPCHFSRGPCQTCREIPKRTGDRHDCLYDNMTCDSCNLCWDCIKDKYHSYEKDYCCEICQTDLIYENEPFRCAWCCRPCPLNSPPHGKKSFLKWDERDKKYTRDTKYCKDCKSLYLINMGKKKKYMCLTCYKRLKKGNITAFQAVFEKKIGHYFNNLLYRDIKWIIQQYILG